MFRWGRKKKLTIINRHDPTPQIQRSEKCNGYEVRFSEPLPAPPRLPGMRQRLRDPGPHGGGAPARVPDQGRPPSRPPPAAYSPKSEAKSAGRHPDRVLSELTLQLRPGSRDNPAWRAPPGRPPLRSALLPGPLLPSGHTAAPPPLPTSFPSAAGTSLACRSPSGVGLGTRTARHVARLERGVRGAGLAAGLGGMEPRAALLSVKPAG